MSCAQFRRLLPHQAACDADTSRLRALAVATILACLGFAGCAQQPKSLAVSHGKEYFPSSVYGRASKRVIADGQPVPRGGGQYLVGKPYTIAGRTYVPSESRTTQVGYASWYGDAFHGRLTANGEIYDRDAFTAASPTMPLPSYARVTNLRNNYSMIVRVNDRGPYASDRIMDVSRRVAEALDYKRYGTTKLKVEYVGRASLAGSDDAKLYATLRTDQPGTWQTRPTMVAAARPRPAIQVASYVSSESESDELMDERPLRETRTSRPPRNEFEVHRTESRPVVAPSSIASRRQEMRDRDDSRASRRSLAEYRGERIRVPSQLVGHADRDDHRHFASRDGAAAFQTRKVEPSQLRRLSKNAERDIQMPPSRPMDLGTIPGAASQIHAHRNAQTLRMARSRDD